MECPIDAPGNSPDYTTKSDDKADVDRSDTARTDQPQWIERPCPVCRKRFRVERAKVNDRRQSTYPFCSERCRMVGLGRWLNADYRFSAPVPAVSDESEDEEE